MQHDESFGHWLTLRRQAARLQRAELATRIGCTTDTLQKIEADERRPSRQFAIPSNERATFIRVARGELPIDRQSHLRPKIAGPTNLPRPTTALTGRVQEVEVEEFRAALSRTEVRLLTLMGAPGVGKTHLAIEAASELHSAFVDGVVFVALAPLSDPDLVLPAIAHSLDVGSSGRQPYCAAAALVRIAAAAWLPGSSYGERRSW
jgi:hypothetical protein